MKSILVVVIIVFSAFVYPYQSLANNNDTTYTKSAPTTNADNSGLKLPAGFSAIKAAEGLGEARHIAVTKNGDIYVKLSRLKNGKGIYFLHDNNGDGKA